jgi:hypothetical protein
MRGAGMQTQAAAVRTCMRISRPILQTGHRRGCSAEMESGARGLYAVFADRLRATQQGPAQRQLPEVFAKRKGHKPLWSADCTSVLHDGGENHG